jgi:opacity protein-like surface antigen
MRTRTTTLWCSVALGGWMIGTANVAGATDHGFYASVDGGVASYPYDVHLKLNGLNYDAKGTAYDTKSSPARDFAWSFAAGYRFNRYWAAEIGFADLGHAESEFISAAASNTNSSPGKVTYSARGKTLALLGHLPIGNWDSYAKVGAIHSTFNAEIAARTPVGEFQRSGSQENTSALVGLGTRYAFNERWAVSFAVDYYVKLGDVGLGRENIFSPRVGFAYRF